MMSHNFFHLCPCSHTTKNALKKGNQCTIANLRKLLWDFFESRSEKKDAKNYGSVIRSPS